MDIAAALMQAIEGNMTAMSYDEKAQQYNEREGNLDGYDCALCKNKGHSLLWIDGYEYTKECACMEVRRSYWRMQRSGLAGLVKQYTFDAFEAQEPYQQVMLDLARAFCERDEGWFYIGGQPGCGKTHICTAMASRFMQRGKAVRYMVWMDEVTKLKAIKMDEEQYQRDINQLKSIPVLYIDDFFKTVNGAGTQSTPTNADIQIAFELLNARYNDSSKITILSGEKSISDIIEIDEALGSRIKHRCGKFAPFVQKGKNRNYRLRDIFE